MIFKFDNIVFTFPKGWSTLDQKTINRLSKNDNGEFAKDYSSKIVNVFISEMNNTIFLKKFQLNKILNQSKILLLNILKIKQEQKTLKQEWIKLTMWTS